MIIITHTNVPGDVVAQMQERFEMDHGDMKKALESYFEEILNKWDSGVVTFFQFLKKDSRTDRKFTHKK